MRLHGAASPVVNALSFDIEDWFHIVEIDAVADTRKWAGFPSLVIRYARLILDILGEYHVKATFFVLGWVAERHPTLARMIAAEGHEIGTHSYWHRRVDQLGPAAFYEDLKRSVDVLEQQAGQKVLGFRAPSFSITPGAEWAFDVLHEVGLVYDASLFPAPRGHGGYPCLQPPHDFTGAPSGRPMRELPMSVLQVGRLKLPFSGGGYMRVLPRAVIRFGFHSFNRRGLPVVIYLHPRDFAPDCPRVPMPPHRRFKCYTGTASTAGKLRMLLRNYRFDTCAGVLGIRRGGA